MTARHSPSALEVARFATALRQAGYAEWLPAFHDAQRHNMTYLVWAARLRGRPNDPVAGVESFAAWKNRPVYYRTFCNYQKCHRYLDLQNDTLSGACLVLIRHLVGHGLLPLKDVSKAWTKAQAAA